MKDIDEWNILSNENSIIVKNKKGQKLKMKIFNFLSTLFGKKDFISRERPILADKIVYIKKIRL